jgi:hemoglobin/transferrin/lactoferrin receptor protein
VILDATGYVNVLNNFTLRAGVFNIFDEKYWWWSDVRGVSSTSVVRDAYTSPGRNFRVSLTARI